MQNEETTDDVQIETQENETAPVEETVAEETQEVTPPEKTPEAELAEAKAEAAKYRRLFEKAQAKPKVAKPEAPQVASPQVNVEEAVLLANGMPDELVRKLKSVAQVQGLSSLIKAQNDPIFVAVKEKFEKEQKQKDASLPASRGSGVVKPKKDFKTPGLSRDEHRKMFESL